ncbi:hypothetical protein SAMN05216559_2295 [Halomicrobium zhouii]|uniref:Uncharacterized protein n=1 Tax=Halomicrobium zhouii TaxID=767519 RepID=A0A1I6L9T3_9EURY|nr:hypothetical protein [Halomicrobium zhouii]SFS00010.1 hypothetical protein SAMN05216559_2295 [Halomicrobium zhouii]
MVSFDWFINPILANWVTILVTSFVTLLAAGLSNYGVKRKFKSAKDKDRQRALEELRTAIENIVINNREKIGDSEVDMGRLGLSSERIDDLIDAAEREHQVSLSEFTTPVSLLQDVDLRIKNSRYLDPEQKVRYSAAITEIINTIREDAPSPVVLPAESAKVLDRISEKAEYPGHNEDIQEIERNLVKYDSVTETTESFEIARRLTVAITALVVSLSTFSAFAQFQAMQLSLDLAGVIITVTGISFFASLVILLFGENDEEIGGILGALFE